MFKNKAFQVKVVNANTLTPDAEQAEPRTRMTPEQINSIVRDNVKYVALLAGAGYVLKRTLDTSSEAALIITRSHFK